MQHALLSELHRRSGYPCVTILVNTTPGEWIDHTQRQTIERLIASADRRLAGDVEDDVRIRTVEGLRRLVTEMETSTCAQALALCASPGYTAAVKLGRRVVERLVIDDTFATRDLVADVNRTATFRVVTVSEHIVRMLYGDRNRLAEQLDERWPLVRDEEQSVASWTRAVVHALRAEQRRHSVPTIVAGVERSVHRALGTAELETVGIVAGNHDRSGWDELHRAAWPLVEGWIEANQMRALEKLDAARSQRRFAGGLDEVWTLAMEGRLDLVVVEDSYAVSARIVDGRLEVTEDREAPDVVDDIVDEIVEAVLRRSGGAVIVPDGTLDQHDRIAAVARY